MKNKFTKVVSICCIIALTLCLAACQNTSAPSSSVSNTSSVSTGDASALPKIGDISLVAGNSTGGWYSIATALADKTNAYFDGFPIVATTGGALGNPQTVSIGEADVGMSYGIFLNMAEQGSAPYDSAMNNLRSIAGMETTAVYMICDASLGCKNLSDLINITSSRSVGSLDASAASFCVQDLIMQEYGLNGISDLQSSGSMYIADGSSLYDSYSDGHFNVMCTMKAVPDSSTVDLLNNRDSTILNLEQNVIDALVEKYDWTEVVIPAGTYNGQTEDVHTVGIKTVLMCREDVPDEVSYYLAKTLYEQKSYFETVQASWSKFDAADMATGVAIELHPGAAAYWKEAGLL